MDVYLKRISKRISILTVVLSFLGLGVGAGVAHADKFVPLPAVGGKQNPHMKIRFVRYDGGTNGQMVIEVKNSSNRSRQFKADGLYFVPKGKPETAPQRLGASGPILAITNGKAATKGKKYITLAPGETRRVRLEVFCIDSHRSSPSRSTKFAIAAKLFPKKLRRQIKAGSSRIYRRYKHNLKRSKSAIQANIWKTRNADWVKLQGERKNEKASNKMRYRRLHRYRYRYRNRIKRQQRR